MSPEELTTQEIEYRLQNRIQQPLYNPYPEDFFDRPPRDAAILIPFTRIDSRWHLLFIRRTEHERDRHGGQVAFPGGGVDPQDASIRAAALRETREEVGIRPQDVRILGRLDRFRSISNYLVTPFVGVFPWPYTFKLEQNEVGRAFTIPLHWLAEPDNHEVRYRQFPGHDPWPVLYFKPYDGEVLWGFSARVMLRLLEILH